MSELKSNLSTDDLIKIMRYCSGLDKGSCEHCPLDAGKKCWSLPGFDPNLTVHDKLLRIAADRLEELNRRAEPENNPLTYSIEFTKEEIAEFRHYLNAVKNRQTLDSDIRMSIFKLLYKFPDTAYTHNRKKMKSR